MRLPGSGPAPYQAEPGAYEGGQYGSQPDLYPPTELAHESAHGYQPPTTNWPSVTATRRFRPPGSRRRRARPGVIGTDGPGAGAAAGRWPRRRLS